MKRVSQDTTSKKWRFGASVQIGLSLGFEAGSVELPGKPGELGLRDQRKEKRKYI